MRMSNQNTSLRPAFFRTRIRIPVIDEVSMTWAQSQADLSHSLRTLIHEWVKKNGFTDPTAPPMPANATGVKSSAERKMKREATKTFDSVVTPATEIPAMPPVQAPITSPVTTNVSPGTDDVAAFLAANRD